MKKTLGTLILMLFASTLIHSEIVYGVSGVFALGTGAGTSSQKSVVTSPVMDMVSITPNPFNPVVKISVISSKTSEVAIYSANGKLITKSHTTTKGEFIWNASSYPSGLYIVKINTTNKQFTRMLTLMK